MSNHHGGETEAPEGVPLRGFFVDERRLPKSPQTSEVSAIAGMSNWQIWWLALMVAALGKAPGDV